MSGRTESCASRRCESNVRRITMAGQALRVVPEDTWQDHRYSDWQIRSQPVCRLVISESVEKLKNIVERPVLTC